MLSGLSRNNRYCRGMAGKEEEPKTEARDELAESLNDLFTSVSAMVKSELQVRSLTYEINFNFLDFFFPETK